MSAAEPHAGEQVAEVISSMRKVDIALPVGEHMAVDLADWGRVRGDVERLGDSIVDWSGIWASIAFGAALALLAILLGIHTTRTDTHKELIGLLELAVAFCLIFALAFGAVGFREHKKHSVTAQAICADMDDIAIRLGHPGLGALPTTLRKRRRWIGLKGCWKVIWSGGGKAPGATGRADEPAAEPHDA